MSTSKKFKASWAIALFLPLGSWAQQNKIAVAPPDPLSIKRGASASHDLKVTVLPGFHVNNDKPRDEFLIPLKLTWTGPLEATTVTYPKPEEIKVGGQTLVVFTGTFVIQTNFKAPEGLAAGATTMTGKLRYQACNNEMCFRPSTVEVKLPVAVE
jgi:DsbC/DsbD-like thiol-disulfide interchange protein